MPNLLLMLQQWLSPIPVLTLRRRSKMAALWAGCAILIADTAKPAQASTSYNAVKNFTIKMNPNGPWSYLATGLLPYKSGDLAGIKGLPYWYSNKMSCCDNAYVVRNETGATVKYLTIVAPTDHLWFDPQNNLGVVVRFRAPKAGSFIFYGDFLGIDVSQTPHNVLIKHNATKIFSGMISAYGKSLPYHQKLTLAAGDTVDFICARGAKLNSLSTGLAVKVIGP